MKLLKEFWKMGIITHALLNNCGKNSTEVLYDSAIDDVVKCAKDIAKLSTDGYMRPIARQIILIMGVLKESFRPKRINLYPGPDTNCARCDKYETCEVITCDTKDGLTDSLRNEIAKKCGEWEPLAPEEAIK